tara:strand:+ start:316 stop:699 length:384 start_codon:yes stop_codon:yes gene_type:complete
MRQRFEARKGSHTFVLYAENWHDALAYFGGCFGPSEESARSAAAYDIVAARGKPGIISEFLKSTKNKGENMSKENVPEEVRAYLKKLGAKGGTNRMKSTTKKQRKDIATLAAKARWAKWREENEEKK